MRVERTWLRGAMALVALAVMSAALVTSQAAAVPEGKEASKRFVKKSVARTGGRVAYATDTAIEDIDPTGSGGEITQLTTEIEAPAPGFLVVEGSMEIFTNEYDIFGCFLRLNGARIPSSERFVAVDPASDDETNCDTHAVVPVAQGRHQVQLVTEKADNDQIHDIAEVLYVVYVPTDGTGRPPSSFGVT